MPCLLARRGGIPRNETASDWPSSPSPSYLKGACRPPIVSVELFIQTSFFIFWFLRYNICFITSIMSNGSAAETYTVPLIINGKDQTSEHAFDIVSPSNSKVIHRYYSADVKHADAAVDAAAEAFKTWRKATPYQRRDVLLKAAEIIEKRRDELREYSMGETGSDAAWADFDISTAIQHIKEVAGRVGTIQGSIPRLADPDTHALILQEPYGVVLAISPWYVVTLGCLVLILIRPGTLLSSWAQEPSSSPLLLETLLCSRVASFRPGPCGRLAMSSGRQVCPRVC
jgi:hypothetical protein